MSKIVASKYGPTDHEGYHKLLGMKEIWWLILIMLSTRLCVMTLISILMMFK